MADVLVCVLIVAFGALIVHSPILKPWFGFRRPPGHRGKWGE